VRALVVASCLSGVIALAGAPAYATDWTQFHFSAAQRGANPFETVLTPATVGGLDKRWTARWFQPPDPFCDVCTGSYRAIRGVTPLQVGDMSIVAFSYGGVRAYDSATGALRWSYYLGEGCCESVNNIAEANGVVYLPFGSDDHQNTSGGFVAIDGATGHALWGRGLNDSEPGGPVVAAGAVYTSGGDKLYALDAATGATLWRRRPWSLLCGACGLPTPAVGGGLVVIATSGLHAYSAASGTLAWKRSDCGGSTPALSGGAIYTSQGCKLDLSTGRLIWKRSIAPSGFVGGSPAVANGMVFHHAFDDYDSESSVIEARNAESGRLLWKRFAGVDARGVTSPSVAGGVVYMASDGSIRAYRATSGALLWRHFLYGAVLATPSIANGQLEIGTVAGRLYAFALP
jgi:outer membrane protein assembly factor BamB